MTNDKTEILDEVIAELIGNEAAFDAGVPPQWYEGPLERGDIGDDVKALRKALGLKPDNRFEHDCEAAVRRFQSARGLKPTGRVNEDLARLIGD